MNKFLKVILILSAVFVSIGILLIGIGILTGASLNDSVSAGRLSITAEDIIPAQYIKEYWEHPAPPAEGEAFSSVVEPASAVTDSSGGVRSIYIDWSSGSIHFVIFDGDKIGVAESAAVTISENHRMVTSVVGSEMHIKDFESVVSFGSLPSKELTVFIPASYASQMQTIKIDSASADCTISGITADKLIFDAASGRLEAADMVLNHMSVHTVSGNVTVSGSISAFGCESTSGDISVTQTGATCEAEAESTSGNISLTGNYSKVDADSTSGKVEVSSAAALRELEIETTSGDVVLNLPAESSFELEIDMGSGSFNSELPLSKRGDFYTLGSGGPEFEVSTTSGDLTINPIA